MKTEVVPSYLPHSSNDGDLDILVDSTSAPVQDSDNSDTDDLAITLWQPHQPMKCTLEGLVKREADLVSGDLPYNVTVSYFS